jgi:hypothetical protein
MMMEASLFLFLQRLIFFSEASGGGGRDGVFSRPEKKAALLPPVCL